MKIEYEIVKKGKGEKYTLQNIELFDNKLRRDLTYWLHDYGRLAYWLKKYGGINSNPLWASLGDIYSLETYFAGGEAKKREDWYIYQIYRLGKEIDVTQRTSGKSFRLGDFGKIAFEAATKVGSRTSWTESMEAIIVLYLLARKIENFGFLLGALNEKSVDVACTKCPRSFNRPKDFQINLKDVSLCIRNAYFVNVELPDTVQELKTYANPVVLSTIILNETYSAISNFRHTIVEKLVSSGTMANPYVLSDRGSYEIKRALERMDVLQKKHGFWFTTLPDRLLLSIGWYALVKMGKTTITPNEFTEVLKVDFRFLVDPDDIVKYLSDQTDYEILGIDLTLLRNNLEQNFSRFLERLVSLGFARIRPDGEVHIGASEND